MASSRASVAKFLIINSLLEFSGEEALSIFGSPNTAATRFLASAVRAFWAALGAGGNFVRNMAPTTGA